MQRIVAALVAVAFALALTACGDDKGTTAPPEDPGGGVPGLGTFTATLTGAENITVTGTAGWASVFDGDSGDGGFGLTLVNQDPTTGALIGFFSTGARRGTGTYDVITLRPEYEDDLTENNFTASLQTATGTPYLSDTGSITVTESAGTIFAGTFEFNATSANLKNPTTVRLTGTFRAEGLDVEGR